MLAAKQVISPFEQNRVVMYKACFQLEVKLDCPVTSLKVLATLNLFKVIHYSLFKVIHGFHYYYLFCLADYNQQDFLGKLKALNCFIFTC